MLRCILMSSLVRELQTRFKQNSLKLSTNIIKCSVETKLHLKSFTSTTHLLAPMLNQMLLSNCWWATVGELEAVTRTACRLLALNKKKPMSMQEMHIAMITTEIFSEPTLTRHLRRSSRQSGNRPKTEISKHQTQQHACQLLVVLYSRHQDPQIQGWLGHLKALVWLQQHISEFSIQMTSLSFYLDKCLHKEEQEVFWAFKEFLKLWMTIAQAA